MLDQDQTSPEARLLLFNARLTALFAQIHFDWALTEANVQFPNVYTCLPVAE
jgi:hypothetical protein